MGIPNTISDFARNDIWRGAKNESSHILRVPSDSPLLTNQTYLMTLHLDEIAGGRYQAMDCQPTNVKSCHKTEQEFVRLHEDKDFAGLCQELRRMQKEMREPGFDAKTKPAHMRKIKILMRVKLGKSSFAQQGFKNDL